MNTVEQILMWLVVVAAFATGIAVGVFMVACSPKLLAELKEIQEKEKK